MKIVTISGLDGSGKSTQIKILKNYLESQGKRVFYFHAVEFSLANKIKNKLDSRLRSPRCSSGEAGGNNKTTSITKANAFQIWLRKIFLRIDIWRFKELLNKFSNKYDYMVSDRYFYDSVVNIEYLEKSIAQKSREQKFLFPMADAAIYLQASPEIIMQRERKPDQGLEYLKTKKELYDTAAQNWKMKIINGNKNKEEIFEEIKRTVILNSAPKRNEESAIK